MARAYSEGSLLLRHLRDRQFLFALPRAVALQMLHPAIAAATREHSQTPFRVWCHKARTVPDTIDFAYSDNVSRTKAMVMLAHENVKGVDSEGHRYHSLNPNIFFYQHATYVESLIFAVDAFRGGLADAEKEAIYADGLVWYERFGISTADVPETYRDFREYFSRTVQDLQPNSDFYFFAAQLLRPDYWWPRLVPSPVVRTFLHERTAALLHARPSAWDASITKLFVAAQPMRRR